MKCQKSMDEDMANGQPASAAGKLSGISNWDARMLLQ